MHASGLIGGRGTAFEPIHASGRWAFMGPTDERFDFGPVALDDRLDATVTPVAHPSVDAPLERLMAEGITESDPLHPPVNRQVGAR